MAAPIKKSSRRPTTRKLVSKAGTTATEQRLQEILNGAQCPHLLYLVPQPLKTELLRQIPGPAEIRRGRSLKMGDDEFSKLQSSLHRELNETTVSLGDSGQQVSIARFFRHVACLMQLDRRCRQTSFRNADEISRMIGEKFQLKQAYKSAKAALNELCLYCGLIYSWPETRLISITPVIQNGLADRNFAGLAFVVEECYSEQQKFKLGDIVRPAFRIGLSCRNKQMNWLHLNQSLFENSPYSDEIKLPVYIQIHATNRMIQRLDIIDRKYFYLYLILALKSQKAFRYKQKTLIELSISGQKAGYLVSAIVDDKILIKTFLLLSDHGTPEGDRAHQLCERHQVDMSQWNTDRLSTFSQSSLTSEHKPKSLVSSAGCHSLFQITPSSTAHPDRHHSTLALSQLLQPAKQGKPKSLTASI